MTLFSRLRSRRAIAATAALAVTGMTGVTLAASAEAHPSAFQRSVVPAATSVSSVPLVWGACPYPHTQGLQCTQVRVPISYANPQGPATTITMDRMRASDPAHRLGDLVMDPGGPGESGTQLVAYQAEGAPLFSKRLVSRYDLIGVDPRGVGLSHTIRCSARLFNQPIDLFPTTVAQYRQLVAHNRALGESCRRLSGPLVAHDDTASATRDLEAIRMALGDSKLNYLGFSYGTELGAEYASRYPHRVGRMVLDGALDPSLRERTMVLEEGRAYSNELQRFRAWCQSNTSCALHGQDPLAVFAALVRSADQHPIPAPGCKTGECRATVTGQDIQANVQGLLLHPQPSLLGAGWPGFAQDLKQASEGNATAFSSPRGRSDDDPAIVASGLPIECLDYPTTADTFAELRALGTADRRANPLTGGLSQSYEVAASCLGWPLAVQDPPHHVDVRDAPPILIVNATHDPSTPYLWARRLQAELHHSVLLTRAGDGHTSYFDDGATQKAEDQYLTTGILPKPRTVLTS